LMVVALVVAQENKIGREPSSFFTIPQFVIMLDRGDRFVG